MILPTGSPRASLPSAVISNASEVLELEVGKQVKIETSPGGVEVLNVTVPPGKHWSVGLTVSVTETDA